MRLNLGCGQYPMEGWTNVDMVPPADVVGDFLTLDFSDVEEVNMDHSLEHVSWRLVAHLLHRIHGWMIPGGSIRIEVPDMAEIMRRGEEDPLGMIYTYGAQNREGEFHYSGFTSASLSNILRATEWEDVQTREFLSEHAMRPGMPCLEATAIA